MSDDVISTVSRAAPDILKHLGFGGAACLAWTAVAITALWRADFAFLLMWWPAIYGTWVVLGGVWFVAYVLGLGVVQSINKLNRDLDIAAREMSDLADRSLRLEAEQARSDALLAAADKAAREARADHAAKMATILPRLEAAERRTAELQAELDAAVANRPSDD